MIFSSEFSVAERGVLRSIRWHGPSSRADLAETLSLRPNTVGDAVAALLEKRVLADGLAVAGAGGKGRPRRPLVLDDTSRHILGIAVMSGDDGSDADVVQIQGVNLQGRALGPAWRGPGGEAAQKAVEGMTSDATLGVSVAVPGLVDVEGKADAALAGSTWAMLLGASGDKPVVIDNDGHALAARWWLSRGAGSQRDEELWSKDVLIIRIGDGRLGASMLIEGRPNRGCVIGGNELGHTRFPIDTPVCFCGQTGCLERIVSTRFLHSLGASSARTLPELCSAYGNGGVEDDAAVAQMLLLLAMGVSNAVQLVRPHRVVVVSELSRCAGFFKAWLKTTRGMLLPELQQRVEFEAWDEPLATPAESAAHLGLAAVFDAAWCRP